VFYIAMELVAAPTLHQHVIEKGPLSPPVASAALLQLAHALAHAHKSGLVHRDIKPSNIMLLPETQSRELVKVLDFGLARLHPVGDHRVTTIHCPEGAAIGTPAFMSPEQIRNFHSTDIRSDLYSLGCTFYFALTGRLPFEGPTTSVTLLMQLNREPASLRSLCPSVPGGLAHIVHRLMAKNPDDRYQTPNELIDALNALVLSTEQADAATATQLAVVQPPHAIEEHRPEPPPSPTPSAVRQVAPDLTSNSTLSRLWGQWCEVLAIASRDETSPYSEAKYKCLHRELMGALVAAGKSVGESSVGYLDWVTSHVEPWVTLDSIYRLDRQTQAELFRTCQALGSKLFPSPTPTRPARAGWMTLAVGFAFALVAYLIVWSWPYWSVDWPSYSELPTPPTAMAVVLLVPMIALMVIVALRKETRV
jgi:eukaryotic-like serine/threonine-protein kinase